MGSSFSPIWVRFQFNCTVLSTKPYPGVVTKLGIHCTPAPEAFISCEVFAPREEDLTALIDILTDLLRRRILSNSPGIANIVGLVMDARDDSLVRPKIAPYVGHTAIPNEVLKEIQEAKQWPWWMSLFSLYGPPEIIKAQREVVQRAVDTIPDARFDWKMHTSHPGQFLDAEVIGPKPELLPQTGRPTLHSLSYLDFRAKGAGHIAFAPVLPPSGRDMYEWYLKAKELTMAAGFDFLADFHLFARYVISIDLVMFASSEQDRMASLLRKLTDMTARLGYTEYRTHVSFMDDVVSHHNFHNGSMGRLTTSLKDLLDPRGVLAPGKSGVWNSSAK